MNTENCQHKTESPMRRWSFDGQPVLPVHVTIGGIEARVAYAGAAPTEVSGLMRVVVYIPAQVQPGGYVPVSTGKGAAWIAVSDQ